MSGNMMQVTHTPLLGPSSAHIVHGGQARQDTVSDCDISRAGLKTSEKGSVESADMRKVMNVQKSPNFVNIPKVILDKSPSCLGADLHNILHCLGTRCFCQKSPARFLF